jgi:hypothetical protein
MYRKLLIFKILIIIGNISLINSQSYIFGWQGEEILQHDIFLNTDKWTPNQSDLLMGDSCYITTGDSAINIHWKFGAGARHKWVQCYMILPEPMSLEDIDIVGIDIRGSDCSYASNRHVELKFEDGTNYAVYTWDNLAQIQRWCRRLTLLKNQFAGGNIINWDAVTVISLAVVMNPDDAGDIHEDSGTVSFMNLTALSVDSLSRADSLETLDEIDSYTLDTIKTNAAAAIMQRQAPTGLIYTWKTEHSSWLYGQGLALKILTEEGEWDNTVPANDYAVAATNLAHFLIRNQAEMGFWPRAWNANTGNIILYVEGDNTVWMGDFPWIVTGLVSYYKRSGDQSVVESINKARSFLYDLVDTNGRINTVNIYTHARTEVSNYEGYAAAIGCLYEMGDTVAAKRSIDYLLENGWDDEIKLFREGPGSSRPVLLVNTWLAALFSRAGYPDMAVDALSLAGKLLYTKGPCEPPGLDGVGPVATWYEGTLSYISALGPGSNRLFEGIAGYINSDGTVPAYNDSLSSMGGIWAVDWSSLDATSWLYYASAQKSPFDTLETIYHLSSSFRDINARQPDKETIFYSSGNKLYLLRGLDSRNGEIRIELYSVSGILMGTKVINPGRSVMDINEIIGSLQLNDGIYIIRLYYNNIMHTRKLVFISP